MILEPCCFNKQLDDVMASPRETEHLFTFGGVDLQMMMDYFIRHSPDCDVHLIMIQLTERTIRTIAKLMEAKAADGTRPLIRSFVLMYRGENRKQIADILGKYKEEGRLLVCEGYTAFRCLCVGNEKNSLVLQGSIPQVDSYAMQMMTLTKSRKHYNHVKSILTPQTS